MKRASTSLKSFKILGEKQKWRCRKCRHRLRSTCQVDHRIPLFKGGTNAVSNLQILCVKCHAKKTQRESVTVADLVDYSNEAKRSSQGHENQAIKTALSTGDQAHKPVAFVAVHAHSNDSVPSFAQALS